MKDFDNLSKADLYQNSYYAFKKEYEQYIRGQLKASELPELGIAGFIYRTILQYAEIMDRTMVLSAIEESLSEHLEDYHFDEWMGANEAEEYDTEFAEDINGSMNVLGKAEGFLYHHMDKLNALLIGLFIRLLEKPELYQEFFTEAIAKKANKLIDKGYFKEIIEQSMVDYKLFLDEAENDAGLAALLGIRLAIEEAED